MKFGTFLGENIRISFSSIASNKLRSILTMAIIAIGIMSLVGIVTAIEAIKSTITDSFSSLGANSLVISSQVRVQGDRGIRFRNEAYISYDQAREFKQSFSIPSSVSLSIGVSGSAMVKYQSLKTDPNVVLQGIDENGLRNSNLNLSRGRDFSQVEVEQGRRVAIIGSDIDRLLFTNDQALDKYINVGGVQFLVIGVLESRGAGIGMGNNDDLRMLVPIETARAVFALQNSNTNITIVPDNPQLLDVAQSEAEGQFRIIRRLAASDASDFSIESSDSLANMMIENIAMVTLAASVIGIITLLGAAVGLMNIMLVSVSERTREIGTRMAIGAKPGSIREQFLFESIIISQMGGVLGIMLGVGCGNLIALLIGGEFFVPWAWVLLGVVICLIVGIASGYIPARKAASLDPVEALRYE